MVTELTGEVHAASMWNTMVVELDVSATMRGFASTDGLPTESRASTVSAGEHPFNTTTHTSVLNASAVAAAGVTVSVCIALPIEAVAVIVGVPTAVSRKYTSTAELPAFKLACRIIALHPG